METLLHGGRITWNDQQRDQQLYTPLIYLFRRQDEDRVRFALAGCGCHVGRAFPGRTPGDETDEFQSPHGGQRGGDGEGRACHRRAENPARAAEANGDVNEHQHTKSQEEEARH